MTTYRYKLEPYAGMATRHTCPRCKAAHKFARYIDTQIGKYVHPTVGRCERTQSCGYHYTPARYFRANGITPPHDPATPQASTPHINLPFVFPFSLIATDHPRATPENTNLLRFIVTALHLTPPQLRALVDTYYLRAASYNRIVFPQVDTAGDCRTAKIMQYNPATGRRIKDTKGSFNWMHRILIKQRKLPANFTLRQCLFGEHLLTLYPECAVAIVESEKTALICSVVYPSYVWLATGGKYNFTADRFRSLAGRIIYAIPDAGALRYWTIKAREISRALSCPIRVSDCVQYAASLADIANGIDIADLILRGQPPKHF